MIDLPYCSLPILVFYIVFIFIIIIIRRPTRHELSKMPFVISTMPRD